MTVCGISYVFYCFLNLLFLTKIIKNRGKSTGSIFMILILKNMLIQFATQMKQSLA